jgi:hypothetical protein
VDIIQTVLGDVLLVLAGLALVLLAVILLLLQANAIAFLGERLTRRLRSEDRHGEERQPPEDDRPHASAAPKKGGD